MSTADEIRLLMDAYVLKIEPMRLAFERYHQACVSEYGRLIEADLRQDAVALMRWDDDGGPSVETIWVFSLPDIRFEPA